MFGDPIKRLIEVAPPALEIETRDVFIVGKAPRLFRFGDKSVTGRPW